MGQINRSCLVVQPKQAFVDWINQRNVRETKYNMSLQSAFDHHTFTFLVGEFNDPDELEDLIEELKSHFAHEVFSFFESDEDLWPLTSNSFFDEHFQLIYSTYTKDLMAPEVIMDYDNMEALETVEKLFKNKKMKKSIETELGDSGG